MNSTLPDGAPGLLATSYALLLLIGLPVLAALDARRGVDLEGREVHRRALYASVALSLLVIAGLTFGVATLGGVDARAAGWRVEDARSGIVWGAGAAVAGLLAVLAVTRAARALGFEESPLAMLLMPRTAPEQRAFLLLSGVAAVCEEFLFRGFLLAVLAGWTGSPWFAAVVVSLSFGLAHGYQKLAGVIRAGTLGMLLAVPTVLTGSLFPAIVGHFWINAAVGLGGWRYLLAADENA